LWSRGFGEKAAVRCAAQLALGIWLRNADAVWMSGWDRGKERGRSVMACLHLELEHGEVLVDSCFAQASSDLHFEELPFLGCAPASSVEQELRLVAAMVEDRSFGCGGRWSASDSSNANAVRMEVSAIEIMAL